MTIAYQMSGARFPESPLTVAQGRQRKPIPSPCHQKRKKASMISLHVQHNKQNRVLTRDRSVAVTSC
jgi:hypothetical protein